MAMDISRRLIGTSAVVSDGKVADVDINGLVRRLLLFDKYILVSARLQEFPILARRLGYGTLRDLLDANLIEIRCECLQLTQIGQSGLFGDPILPPFSYKFNWIDMHDRQKYIHDCLQGMHEFSGLQHKEVLRLKRSIIEAITPLPSEVRPSLFPPFRSELLNNPPLLRKSIELSLRHSRHLEDVPFLVRIHEEAEDKFVVESDLAEKLRIESLEAHKIIEAGTLGLAALTQAIGEMKAYSAISGFRDEELPLFRDKLDLLADTVSSEPREGSFQRIVTIAGLPEFSQNVDKLNVDTLVKVRDSSEAREFRDWLQSIGTATDSELRERVAGFGNMAGLFLSKPAVKHIKFLALCVAGFIPHTAIPAAALGMLDHFLLEKLLPRSSIAAFINELYPSIFENRQPSADTLVRGSEEPTSAARASGS